MLIEVQEFLSKHDGCNLIVFDNIQNNDEVKFLKSFITNFNVLITTRIDSNNIKNFSLSSLCEEDCKKLFLEYYRTDENIDNILKYLDYHTLFTELTAKTLNCSSFLTIEKLEYKFKTGEFHNIYNNYSEKNFNNYLNDLFSIEVLSEEEVKLLRRLSIFPSFEIDFFTLCILLNIRDNEQEIFDKDLHMLVKSGWIIKRDNTFKVHQIIKEFLFVNYRISYKEIDFVVYNLIKLINVKDLFTLEYLEINLHFLLFGISAINYIGVINKEMICLSEQIATAFFQKGNYEKALEYSLLAIKNFKELSINDKKEFARLNNNISEIYKELNMLEECFEAITITLNIQKELYSDKYHKDFAKTYNNISSLHMHNFEYLEAYDFAKKAIAIYEKYNDNELDLSVSYGNLSLICNSLKLETKKEEYSKEAYRYLKKAIEIEEKLIPNSKLLALNYNNLSLLYKEDTKYDEAVLFQLISLNIFEKYFTFMVPQIAKGYGNLAWIYYGKKELELSLDYQMIAYEKRLECFQSPHPEIANSLHEISHVYKDMKNYEFAVDYQLKALNIYKKCYGNHYYDIFDSYLFLATVYIEEGINFQKASYYLEISIVEFKKSKFFNKNTLLFIEYKLAKCYEKMNEKKKLKKSIENIDKMLLKLDEYPLEIFIGFNELKKNNS